MNNNAVIYLRFSSQSQDSQTIEVQRKICTEYAINNGLNIIKEYVDEAKSGRNGNRDGLQEIIKDAKSGLFKYMIVYNADRFWRDAGDGINTVKELEKNGVAFLSTSEPYSNNASGKLSRNMNFVIAQYYSDLYSEKITNGIANNASKFLSIGGQISFGYKTVDKVIYVDEEKAQYVKTIFIKYLRGESIIDIARYLNDLGIKTNKGGTFGKNSLRTILTNKRYIGIYTYKGKEFPNSHPRILEDDSLFYKVQEKMAKNQKAPACHKAKEPYILTGKAFCGHCGDMLHSDGGQNRNKVYYRYYACKTRKKDKTKCNKENIPKEKLEYAIVSEARKILNDKVINEIIKDATTICEKDRDTATLLRLNKQLKGNQKMRDNLINAVATCEETSLQKTFFAKISEIDNQVIAINKEITKEEKKHVKVSTKLIKFYFNSLKKGNLNDITYQRRLVNLFVNKVYVFDNIARIHFNISENPVEVDLSTIKKAICSNNELCSPPIF